MSQVTNLNVAPYFDDFNSPDGAKEKDYYQVLFKPGYPVQARELTTLQSILQNQIERFGQHFFKEGAKVIPGNTSYNPFYYAVQLQNTYLGVPVDLYASLLVGKKITGATSGVTATVDRALVSTDSERGNTTLYIQYLNSNQVDNTIETFTEGELLTCSEDILTEVLGSTVISAGEPFASTLETGATATGSSFQITNGVYFIRGRFVSVESETLLLDQYDNTPSYRVGLNIVEEIVNSDIDDTLNDNSQGYNNYAAPGADRLKISVSLTKKALDNYDDNNFVELAVVQNGSLRSQKVNTEYNVIAEEFARRTFSESGNYTTKAFDVFVNESLNDREGNRGIFNDNQLTPAGSVPNDDLALYRISPGKAFVRGFEVETISPSYLDVPKPRTTKTATNQSIAFNTGSSFTLNRVYGAPTTGIGNTYTLSLRNERVGSDQTATAGKEIGLARVYDFALESGSYDTDNSDLNRWKISLYDIQTTSEITVNEPITLTVPTYIKGNRSGATAFLKDAVTSQTTFSVYEKNGEFVTNESFTINGINDTRVSIAVTSYGISDVKSVYGIVGSAKTFTADIIPSVSLDVGSAVITPFDGAAGVSTITSTNDNFPNNTLKVGTLVRYSDPDYTDPVVASIVSVGTTQVTVSGVTTVPGIARGALPSSTFNATDFKVLTSNFDYSSDNTLYTLLPKPVVSSVDLSTSSISIRKQYSVDIADGELSSSVSAGTNETFLPFDEERYTLVRSDGSYEILRSDKLSFSSNFDTLQIYGLGSDDTGATLHTTLRKNTPTSKIKNKNRVNTLIVNASKNSASGIGSTTLNDGLTYGNYPYGTRVQDDKISLNVPDIVSILGVFESTDTSDPSAPKASLSSINSPTSKTTDLIIGERFVGRTSGASGIVAERVTDSQISFIIKSSSNFSEGEIVEFKESGVQAVISSLTSTSLNISSKFSYQNGQNGSFYNYGYLSKKSSQVSPLRKIKIYFSNGFYEPSDNGDITTANSYQAFNFSNEIPRVDTIRNTNIIDIRPRVSNYNVVEGSRSPFEFYGRLFNSSGSSSANILASDETITISFAHYLGRTDRIFLSADGRLQVSYGVASEKTNPPITIEDALEIASIQLPPYLFNVSDASVRFLENKGYKMSDIRKLENRIKNLEYYTTLSLLETQTSSLFIPDANGLNRFKSGFVVDNFKTLLPQEIKIPVNNSVDTKNQEVRPRHYTTSLDLVFGPVVNIDPNRDLAFTDPEGNNIKKSGDIVTLDYTEVEWLNQPFATRTESITPYIISFWQATLELTPPSDTWVNTVTLEPKIINTEGNYSDVVAQAVDTLGFDPNKGFAPVAWDVWETDWIGTEVLTSTNVTTDTTFSSNGGGRRFTANHPDGRSGGTWIRQTGTFTDTVTEETIQETVTTGQESRTGTQTFITETYDVSSTGVRQISTDLVKFMRSRNVQIVAKRLKPNTRLYGFFDGVEVTNYCIPKLLDISMVSGVFQVGETVIGTMNSSGLNRNIPGVTPRISFRLAASKHREGPYNNPTRQYTQSPYSNRVIPSTYTSTAEILNVDTFSLSNEVQGEYSGWVSPGMVFVGQTSGAVATLNTLQLVSDISSNCIFSFFIPDPNINTNPRFETGTRTFTLINNNTNDQNKASTIGEDNYTASGTIETFQEEITSVRNAAIENKQVFEERAIFSSTGPVVVDTNVTTSTRVETQDRYVDPLAQSFLVAEDNGIFLTSCDVFFQSKDDGEIPAIIQLRSMQNGIPTQKVLPFSEVVLSPDEINTSADGSVPTRITFKSPVYLKGGGTEYALCLLSLSTKYQVFISRIGEEDLLTQTFISNQPYLGSLFKSQNGFTWDASQWEDLKFTLYRADFVTKGDIQFYNPILSQGNDQVAKLLPDSLDINSREIRVGFANTINDSGLTLGNTVLQYGTNATGNYVGSAGSATGTLNIIDAGIGYTPASGGRTFGGVNLVTITGTGRNATAEITISNGTAIGATITNGGLGYQVGDVLGIGTIGSIPTGVNAQLSVTSISDINELILDNVQGEFVVSGAGNTVSYINNSGITTELNYSDGANVQISNIEVANDGLHIVVNHKNSGMYFEDNYVTVSDVDSDIIPTKLTTAYNTDSTTAITVEDASSFTQFENVGVGTTNVGYLKIGDEVIGYTEVVGNTIGGTITRNISGFKKNYPVGTLVYKYELGGVSLRRINKTHQLSDATVSDPISFDSYNIKIDMSANGKDRSTDVGFPKLYFNESKFSGGNQIKSTQNIPFEIISPMVQHQVVTGTKLDAKIRTITGQSLSGTEVPYQNAGYENVTLNKSNYLTSTRIVCSDINETNNLTGLSLPGNRSFNMQLDLETIDSKVSPVIDTQRVSAIFVSNRVNSAITNYATDSRANSLLDDPTAFTYISKEVTLENPATSLKILLSAYINEYSDIRAFYAISDRNGFDPVFVPFPGYANLDYRGRVINAQNNDGTPDTLVPKSQALEFDSSKLDFRENVFTIDELPSFRVYRVKIVATSTNQAYPPRFKELRTIALA
jgi:hypothetical protein